MSAEAFYNASLESQSLAGTSRTAAGKRMWCTAHGCTWSAVVAERASDQNIVITHDGKNIVGGMEMIRLGSLKHLEDDIELCEQVFDDYVNQILDCL